MKRLKRGRKSKSYSSQKKIDYKKLQISIEKEYEIHKMAADDRIQPMFYRNTDWLLSSQRHSSHDAHCMHYIVIFWTLCGVLLDTQNGCRCEKISSTSKRAQNSSLSTLTIEPGCQVGWQICISYLYWTDLCLCECVSSKNCQIWRRLSWNLQNLADMHMHGQLQFSEQLSCTATGSGKQVASLVLEHVKVNTIQGPKNLSRN